MSRFRRFTRSIASAYLAIGVNICYTIFSIPLILSHVDTEEFGLWALAMQITAFLGLIEVGMSGSVYRFLIDHKDQQENEEYRAIISTGLAVFAIQGLLVVLLGWSLAPYLGHWMGIQAKWEPIFGWLIRWQCMLTGLALFARAFTVPLQSHQRTDALNYLQMGSLGLTFAALWVGLALGWGLKSLPFSTACGALFQAGLGTFVSARLHFLPKWKDWVRPQWPVFLKLFHFGLDITLMTIGAQLLNASQIIVVSHTMGLSAATAWAICTKLFTLCQQLVFRVPDIANPGLTEMYVRQEHVQLQRRFREMMTATLLSALWVGGVIALVNSDFVVFWTSKSFPWSRSNDPLLALYLISVTISRCLILCVGFDKRIGGFRYVYFLEGAMFATGSWLAAPYFGFAGVIVAGILADVICCGIYGFNRTATFFAQARGAMLGWFWKPASYGLCFAATLVGIAQLTAHWRPLYRMFGNGILAALTGLVGLWFLGLTGGQRREITKRLALRFGASTPSAESKN